MLEIRNDKTFKTLFFGVGGTGSNLLPFISQIFTETENSITIIDGDIIEEKNLKNQKFTLKDIGKSKSEVLSERYKRVYPSLNISCINRYMYKEDEEFLVKIINKSSQIPILIGAVDNNITRKLLHTIFHDDRIKNCIYIDSGNGTDSRTGQIMVGYKADGKIIFSCAGDKNPDIINAKDKVVNTDGCAARAAETPQNIATNVYAAANIFTIINNIVYFHYINNPVLFFNAETTEVQTRDPYKEVQQ